MIESRADDGGISSAVVSPCINVCKMEGELCVGCLRTLAEIAGWANAGDDDKRLIIAAVAERRRQRAPAQS